MVLQCRGNTVVPPIATGQPCVWQRQRRKTWAASGQVAQPAGLTGACRGHVAVPPSPPADLSHVEKHADEISTDDELTGWPTHSVVGIKTSFQLETGINFICEL